MQLAYTLESIPCLGRAVGGYSFVRFRKVLPGNRDRKSNTEFSIALAFFLVCMKSGCFAAWVNYRKNY